MFKNRNSVNLCQNRVSQNWGDVKNEVSKRKLIFCFCLFVAAREKEKWKKAPKHYKNSVFKWLSKNEKKGFLAKIAWHDLCQEERENTRFRAHYLFWPKNFLWSKTVKTRKNNQNSGFSGDCPKPRMTYGMGEKVGFTNCVFEKLCSSDNTIF